MPTDHELEEYYAGEYRLDYQFAFGSRPPKFHLNRSRQEANHRLKFLAPAIKPASRILDFGAGSGEFLFAAQSVGHSVVGFEPSSSFAEFARTEYKVDVKASRWQDFKCAEKQFDVITANHVLEHLTQPVAALKKMTEWLSDDGIIFISVPNVLGKRERSFQHFHFAHVYNFTPNALIWAALIVGLEPDPRFQSVGTTIVFRRREGGALSPAWPLGEAERVAKNFNSDSVLGYFLSFAWLSAAIRRWRKVAKDSTVAPRR